MTVVAVVGLGREPKQSFLACILLFRLVLGKSRKPVRFVRRSGQVARIESQSGGRHLRGSDQLCVRLLEPFCALQIDSSPVSFSVFSLRVRHNNNSSGSNWFNKPQSRRKSGKKGKVTFSDQQDSEGSSSTGSTVTPVPSPNPSTQRLRYLDHIFGSAKLPPSGDHTSAAPAAANSSPSRSIANQFDRSSSFRHSSSSSGHAASSSGPYNRRPPVQRKVGQRMADCEKEEASNLVSDRGGGREREAGYLNQYAKCSVGQIYGMCHLATLAVVAMHFPLHCASQWFISAVDDCT